MQFTDRIFIGTSGWDYPEWRSRFYPADVSRDHWLTHYTQQFKTLEINHSFYQLPESKTLTHWRSLVPDDFRFAVKASRYITHNKKLKDPQEPVTRFMERVVALEDNLGPILFQLPPHWHCNRERLAQFLQVLPSGYDYSFEFRDRSWHCPEIYDTLAQYGASFCIFDLKQRTSEKAVTADHIYIRLHGPRAEPYTGNYDPQALAGWAGAFSTWGQQGKTIYCYFNNDKGGCAPQDALALQKIVTD